MSQRKDVRDRLAQLQTERGRLTASDVLADARSKDSPLHGEFDWDDASAARKHRLDQARSLIRLFQISVQYGTTVIRVPQFIRDPEAGAHEQGYVSTLSLVNAQQQAEQAVVNEFARARAALERARNVATALGVSEEIDSLLLDLSKVEQQISRPAKRRVRRAG